MTTVLKFGGTSVATADAIERVCRIVRGASRPVIVVSATAGTTNALIGAARAAAGGDVVAAESVMARLAASHDDLLRKTARKDEGDAASALEELSTRESAKLLVEILPSWLRGEIATHEQNHDIATWCPAYTKEDGLLDLNDDAYKNLLKIRAFDTTVGTHAFFERSGKRLRVQILEAHIESTRLIIDKVKPEGKKEMGYEEFLRSGATPSKVLRKDH